MQKKHDAEIPCFSEIEPFKNRHLLQFVSAISERPIDGIRVNASYNVFGSGDFSVWFEADSNENAIHFVGEKIRSIEGVNETLTTCNNLKRIQHVKNHTFSFFSLFFWLFYWKNKLITFCYF